MQAGRVGHRARVCLTLVTAAMTATTIGCARTVRYERMERQIALERARADSLDRVARMAVAQADSFARAESMLRTQRDNAVQDVTRLSQTAAELRRELDLSTGSMIEPLRFDVNSAELADTNKVVLDQVATALSHRPALSVALSGAPTLVELRPTTCRCRSAAPTLPVAISSRRASSPGDSKPFVRERLHHWTLALSTAHGRTIGACNSS